MGKQVDARRKAGRKLAEIIEHLGLLHKDISKATGVDMITIQNLTKFTPHILTIERIAAYIEKVTRKKN